MTDSIRLLHCSEG